MGTLCFQPQADIPSGSVNVTTGTSYGRRSGSVALFTGNATRSTIHIRRCICVHLQVLEYPLAVENTVSPFSCCLLNPEIQLYPPIVRVNLHSHMYIKASSDEDLFRV